MAIATINKRYKDLDLNFEPHPITGDITILTEQEAVSRSIRNLVLTSNYERPFQPELGSQVNNALFELDTFSTITRLRTSIEDVINNHEPRAELLNVNINPLDSGHTYEITIVFSIVSLLTPLELTLFLERAR